MPEAQPPKKTQLNLEEYKKVQEKQAKQKLKLQFPMLLRWMIAIPAAYLVFLVAYFLFHVRFLSEH